MTYNEMIKKLESRRDEYKSRIAQIQLADTIANKPLPPEVCEILAKFKEEFANCNKILREQKYMNARTSRFFNELLFAYNEGVCDREFIIDRLEEWEVPELREYWTDYLRKRGFDMPS